MKLFTQRYGDGPTLLMLHGLFGMSDNLAAVGKSLAHKRHVVIADLRNHGRSPHRDDHGYPQLAQDILQLMDDEGFEQADLLGHSMGGKVAMQLASFWPHRFRRVVVADIAPVTYPHHHDLVFAGLYAVREAACVSRALADKVLAAYVSDAAVRQFLLKSLAPAAEGGLQWRFNLDALHDNYDAICSAPVLAHAFEGPALVIKGDKSQYLLPEHRAAFDRFVPHAQLKVIADAGHWLHAEKPVSFTRVVADFLDASA